MTRARGAWEPWGLFLIIFHFAIPFLLLLQRQLKRRMRYLSWIASALLVSDLLVVIWMVEPAFQPDRIHIHPLDLTAVIGIGGLWVAAFIWQLKRRPLLPLHPAQAEGVPQHGD
jgi:amino acid transporter